METAAVATMAEWRERVAARHDMPFSPPPFRLFMADETVAASPVRFGRPGCADWLAAEVARRRFGDAYDLEISAVAVHGPARDAHERAVVEGELRPGTPLGTGLLRDFLREAEAAARAANYGAVVCLGVADRGLWPALARYGYRNFEAANFRKIVRRVPSPGRASAGSFYRGVVERFGDGRAPA